MSGVARIYQFTAVDANHAWAMIAGDGILRTQDGGATWTVVAADTLHMPNDPQFFDAANGWIADDGQVLSTSDGGETWTTRFLIPAGKSIGTISFVDMNTGWVTDWDGGLYRTTNGGTTWTTLSSPPVPRIG